MAETAPHPIESMDQGATWNSDRCSIARTLEQVSTRSAFLMLREAAYGTSRFEDFAHRADLSEPVVAKRLGELADLGLLEREPYREPGQRTRHGYVLTDKGRDLVPALIALMQWGDRWLDDAGGPIVVTHRGCGEEVRAELRCAGGHRLEPVDLRAELRASRPSRKR